jgi:hypothetical protein
VAAVASVSLAPAAVLGLRFGDFGSDETIVFRVMPTPLQWQDVNEPFRTILGHPDHSQPELSDDDDKLDRLVRAA